MADQTQFGAFVETTGIFDSQKLFELDPNSDEFKDFIVRLRQRVNNISMILNIKDSGYYPLTEFVTGELYFPDPTLNSRTPQLPEYRQVYRTVVNFGTLPNTGLKSVAHGLNITNQYSSVKIYGSATDPVGLLSIPLPYASPVLANNIELNYDATNVNIITGANMTAFTNCTVTLSYLKN